ncbi:MAG: hypothetical protein JWO09_3397 [Bacteroidetes bacterium]|nr:hypothetical protein [Bacteroidota bacterium]
MRKLTGKTGGLPHFFLPLSAGQATSLYLAVFIAFVLASSTGCTIIVLIWRV